MVCYHTTRMSKTDTKTTLYLNRELKDWLKEFSFKTDKSQGEIIREALTQYRETHT